MGHSQQVDRGRSGLGAAGDATERMRPAGRPAERAGRPAAREGSPVAGGPRVLGLLGGALLLAMVAAQVASGLQPRPILLTSVVVILLAAGAVVFAARAHTFPRAVAAFAAAVLSGYAAEWIGIRTGLPFGPYHYTGVLRPQLGSVPVIVALAWGGMGLAAHATAAAVFPAATAYGRAARVATGAAALTAWDLFLDPQMLRLGLWVWHDGGPYRGVPLSNFAGWLLVSALVMVLIDVIVADPAARSAGLRSVYAVMAFMETVGFAAVFDPPDRLVAATGGACMGVFAVLAWWRGRRAGPA
ncbi:carotenoid biosynthesis protein [Streptosporangium sandarakinum]|uniref:Putative membrane protein n=1 Tax=Streptosporangium sandarakinum TaxID=1260955 RepID=A0A852UQL8_9ACTN|nr:putative membrane protein [Streptosporangium sandarakinum]